MNKIDEQDAKILMTLAMEYKFPGGRNPEKVWRYGWRYDGPRTWSWVEATPELRNFLALRGVKTPQDEESEMDEVLRDSGARAAILAISAARAALSPTATMGGLSREFHDAMREALRLLTVASDKN
jgi:hypothetical protein